MRGETNNISYYRQFQTPLTYLASRLTLTGKKLKLEAVKDCFPIISRLFPDGNESEQITLSNIYPFLPGAVLGKKSQFATSIQIASRGGDNIAGWFELVGVE